LPHCTNYKSVKWDRGEIFLRLITYAALERATVDIIRIQLADSHSGILVRIHFDECKATIGLETSLENVSEVLEQRHQVILGSIGSQVTDVAGSLPLRSLLDNHIVALDTLSGEVVVTERSGGGHAHSSHSLLLRDGGLTLLICPVATDSARAQPLAVHCVKRLVGIAAITKSDEAISTRTSSLHVPHHTGLRDGAKGRESLSQNIVVDFVAQVADKDVEMVGSVLFVGVIGLISPVDTNFL